MTTEEKLDLACEYCGALKLRFSLYKYLATNRDKFPAYNEIIAEIDRIIELKFSDAYETEKGLDELKKQLAL